MVFPVPGRVRVSRDLGVYVRDLLPTHALRISCDLARVTYRVMTLVLYDVIKFTVRT